MSNREEIIFKNDNNTKILLFDFSKNILTERFARRDQHEVFFRRINSYLIKNNYVTGNIIDLGAWIGDNSIPWAKQIKNTVYAIDPSPENITFINSMCKLNNITNIKTIQKAITNNNITLYTDAATKTKFPEQGNLHHCSFLNSSILKDISGSISVEAVSLDYLFETNEIENVSLIHLDVEGLEAKVVEGSTKIIDHFHPIITFEQHLTIDNYLDLSLFLYKKGYNIYLINEMLPGCRYCCRNFVAFHRDLNVNINDINIKIGKGVLLSVMNHNTVLYKSLASGNILKKDRFYTTTVAKNVRALQIASTNGLCIYCTVFEGYTIMVVVDRNRRVVANKRMLGTININCSETILNCFKCSQLDKNINFIVKDIIYTGTQLKTRPNSFLF